MMKSYHLRWSSHLPNMGQVFSSLYQSEGLSDVTLVCGDGSIKAHKLLLSTCSDYFLELFLESSAKVTLLVMPHVSVADLRDLLAFIYNGEVKVNEDGLSSLLEVAEMLGVRGLKSDKNNQKKEADEDDNDEEDEEEDDTNTETENQEENDGEVAEGEEGNMNVGVVGTGQETKCNLTIEPVPAHVNQDFHGNQQEEEGMNTGNQQNGAEDGEEEQEEVEDDQNTGHQDGTNDGGQVKHEPSVNIPDSGYNFATNVMNQSGSSTFIYPGGGVGGGGGEDSSNPSNPLVNMSNHLAAMYQQAQQQSNQPTVSISPVKSKSKKSKKKKDLQQYQAVSQNGKLPIDLLPEDVNSIMAQAASPVCPLCGKDCANFPNLRSHLQVHNSIKPFSCTFCEAKFARVSHLNRHIRTHTGERPFACERCGKSFARQDKLKVHTDRHASRGGDCSAATLSPLPKKSKKDKSPKKNKDLLSDSGEYSSGNSLWGGHTNPNSLWGGFPLYTAPDTLTPSYTPVYPGMLPPTAQTTHHAQFPTAGASSGELQTIMRIGECSVKPLGQ